MILVAGEALIDLVVSFDGSIEAHPGGAPFNVCRTIARLEREAAFLGALSDDRFGTTLGGTLASEGVDLSAVVTVTRPTTIALAELDETGAATYHFYVEGTSAPAVDEAAAACGPAAGADRVARGHAGSRPRATRDRHQGARRRRRRRCARPARPQLPAHRHDRPRPLSGDRRAVRAPSRRDQGQRRGSRIPRPRWRCRAGDPVTAAPGGRRSRDPRRRRSHDRDRRPDRRHRRTASDRRRHGRRGRRLRRRVPGLLGRARSRSRGRRRSRASHRRSPLRRAGRRDDLRARRCRSPRRSEVEARVTE